MRDFGKVHQTFWSSDTTRGMSERARLFALYLLTNAHGNMLGCYRLPDGYACDDLGLTPKQVGETVSELFQNGFATRDAKSSWVVVHQFLKWNPLSNPNMVKAAAKLFAQTPADSGVKGILADCIREHDARFTPEQLAEGGPFREPFPNGFETVSKHRDRDRDRDLDKSDKTDTSTSQLFDPTDDAKPHDTIADVFAYWQQRMNSPRSALDDKRKRLIAKALGMGYGPGDLKRAIYGCSLSAFHMGENDKGTAYNGLDLILRNAEKIDGFIAMAANPPALNRTQTPSEQRAQTLAILTGQQRSGGDADPYTIDA